MPDPVRTVFRQPFAEQLAAFRLRLGHLVPTRAHDDMRHNAHDRGFMVAGAMKADLLADLAMAVEKAISQGTTLDQFRKDFRAIVEKHGWHGWTGEGTAAGEAWRTRVIYRTNLATSYAAGRRAQLIAGKFKFWVYRHSGAEHPRLHHLAWDGIALPPDHPFWATHSPPNGWGCGCRVFGARNDAGIKRAGGTPGRTLPDGWNSRDPRTGTPPGIGKGWDYAPGASATGAIRDLSGKLDQLPERLSIDLIQSWIRTSGFEHWMADPKGSWPLVRLSAEEAEQISSSVTVAHMSAETMAKQMRHHGELTAQDYANAQRVVSTPTDRVQDSPRSLIFIRDETEGEGVGGYVLVVKATMSGEGLFVTSFRRLSRDQALRDREIGRLLGKGRR